MQDLQIQVKNIPKEVSSSSKVHYSLTKTLIIITVLLVVGVGIIQNFDESQNLTFSSYMLNTPRSLATTFPQLTWNRFRGTPNYTSPFSSFTYW